MKNVRLTAIVIASLMWGNAIAFDPKVDLKDVEVLAQGQCPHEGRTYVCFVVKKNDAMHIVVVDSQGVLIVYRVTEIKQDYEPEDVTVVWRRNPERRKDNASTT